jgi:thiamine biosynthesis lipoprotein
MHSLVFEAIGTHWRIDFALPDDQVHKVELEIRDTIEGYDKTYSRFRSDALLVKASKESGVYTLPANSKELFSFYKALYECTGGLFTPLIGQVLSDAGYDARYSLVPQKLHSPPPWEEVITFEFPNLALHTPALLDFGAAGKGQLIDLVGIILESHNCREYIVDAGGDIRHRGLSAISVGFEHPIDLNQVIGVATIQDVSICGSAGNRRNWGKYHHIMNPSTLESPSDIIAVWVMAETTMLADGLSTALFFVPPEKLESHFQFEYVILYQDFSIQKSIHFPATFFTAES